MKLKVIGISIAMSLMLTGCGSDSTSTKHSEAKLVLSELQEGMSYSMAKGIVGSDGHAPDLDSDFTKDGQSYTVSEFDLSDDSTITCIFSSSLSGVLLSKCYMGLLSSKEAIEQFSK